MTVPVIAGSVPAVRPVTVPLTAGGSQAVRLVTVLVIAGSVLATTVAAAAGTVSEPSRRWRTADRSASCRRSWGTPTRAPPVATTASVSLPADPQATY